MYSHLGITCLRSACGMCALCERESWRICHGVGSELHVLYIKTRCLGPSGKRFHTLVLNPTKDVHL